MESLLVTTRTYVQSYMSHYDSSHDFAHIERVLALAYLIAGASSTPPLDLDVVTLAALLHDVGDRKYLQPGEDASRVVYNFLCRSGANTVLAQKVQTVVSHVSFSNEVKNPEAVLRMTAEHPELAVVQDADRLDAIGAVGIGRTLTYSAAVEVKNGGRRLGKLGSMDDAIRHFDDKLEQLEGMMKTQAGREMAVVRTKRLKEFKSWWKDETGIIGGKPDRLHICYSRH